MMQLVIIAIGVVIALIVIALIVIGIIKITHKNDFSDEYEIDFDFEKKHKGNFVNRFETNYFDFRNHID